MCYVVCVHMKWAEVPCAGRGSETRVFVAVGTLQRIQKKNKSNI